MKINTHKDRSTFDEKLVTHYFEYDIPCDELEKTMIEFETNPLAIEEFVLTWSCAGLLAKYGEIEFARMRKPLNGRKFVGFNFYNDVHELDGKGLFVKSQCYAMYSNDEMVEIVE